MEPFAVTIGSAVRIFQSLNIPLVSSVAFALLFLGDQFSHGSEDRFTGLQCGQQRDDVEFTKNGLKRSIPQADAVLILSSVENQNMTKIDKQSPSKG
jgi:hypothetical protein